MMPLVAAVVWLCQAKIIASKGCKNYVEDHWYFKIICNNSILLLQRMANNDVEGKEVSNKKKHFWIVVTCTIRIIHMLHLAY